LERGKFYHKRILAAIAQRDPEAAREAMVAHLKQVLADSSSLSKR
jgi:DNA-binding FadR family transcriptional regulator